MPPSAHALLSASSAKRWMSCTPSVRLEEKLKARIGEGDKDTSYSREGTKAHELAELKLRRALGELNDYNYAERVKDLEVRFGVIDREMELCTDEHRDLVMEALFEARQTCSDAQLMLETRLDFSKWVPHGFGTGDQIIIGDGILDVIDLKYGKGAPVDAHDNPQIRLYGLGAIELLGDIYDFDRVRLTISQPRLDSVTSEMLTREELLRWGEDTVKSRAKLAWAGEGEYAPGDHCRFCAAKAVCAARAAEALNIFKTGLDRPALIEDEQIPGILAYADVAKSWIKDLEDYAQAQALKGQQWRGYKLVRGRSNRSWTDAEAAVENLIRAGYDRADIFKTELRSVSEMEKFLGKKDFRTFVEAYTFKSEGKPTLVPESDRRQAINTAETDFSDLVG